jgi:hypothetical protein
MLLLFGYYFCICHGSVYIEPVPVGACLVIGFSTCICVYAEINFELS